MDKRRRTTFSTLALSPIVAASLIVAAGVSAHADPADLPAATAQVSALEETSAEASRRASRTRTQLADAQERHEQAAARTQAARPKQTEIAAENGLRALPSATKFVTIDCGRDGDFARRVLAECQSRGLFIRMPGVAPLDRCLRISIGPETALDVVEEVLPLALKAAD